MMGAWRLPAQCTAIQIDLDEKKKHFIFSTEIPITVRLCERTWQYRYASDTAIFTSNYWRLEASVGKEHRLLHCGQKLIVAMTPYSTNWVKYGTFKTCLKRHSASSHVPAIPTLTTKTEIVEWLEKSTEHDPWETCDGCLAGIALPVEFLERSRTSSKEFLFGICQDPDPIQNTLIMTQDIRQLLRRTEENDVVYLGCDPTEERKLCLYSQVIQAAEQLMILSIQQALAGPTESVEKWIGQPVSRLAERIYVQHLHKQNRIIEKRRRN